MSDKLSINTVVFSEPDHPQVRGAAAGQRCMIPMLISHVPSTSPGVQIVEHSDCIELVLNGNMNARAVLNAIIALRDRCIEAAVGDRPADAPVS